MYEENNKMYGLVRQLGPWKPVEKDIFNFAAPASQDPSDVRYLAPDGTPNVTNTHNEPSQMGGGVTVIKTPYKTTVIQRVIDDPRVHTPGRRLDVNRLMGADRMPLEPGLSIGPSRAMVTGPLSVLPDLGEAKTPYTMPDINFIPPPLSDEQKKKIVDDQNANTSFRQTGFGAYYDPSKMMEVWGKMTADERKIAKEALTTFGKMTPAQRTYEFAKENSIIRRIYTLYKGEQAAYYMSDVLAVAADVLQFVALFV